MKLRVDDDRCQGHALCSLAAPEVFLLNDDGYASVAPEFADGVPAAEHESVRTAADGCPERAIVVVDG